MHTDSSSVCTIISYAEEYRSNDAHDQFEQFFPGAA